MVTFAEGLLLRVKVSPRLMNFIAFQADLATGLPPLLVVKGGGHAPAQGRRRVRFSPAFDFRHPQNAG
jgi:hypothetical protein